MRTVIIGNAGGGKSTLARRLARRQACRHVEVDRLLWLPGWVPAPVADYDRAHDAALAQERWVMDGLGRQPSIPRRLARAVVIVLVDMPLWVHFWLAAERQATWAAGRLGNPPAGLDRPPPTEALFRSIWDVDRDWMPVIRTLCAAAEARGARLHRIESVPALDAFAAAIEAGQELS